MPATADPLAEAIAKLDNMAKRVEQEKRAALMVEIAEVSMARDTDKRRCFFKAIALQLDCKPDWDVETAMTDGASVRYNPGFIANLTQPECVGVLMGHEPLHPGFKHHSRCAGRNLKLWNIVADWEVNETCREVEFTLPPTALYPGMMPDGKTIDVPPGLAAEDYYELVEQKMRDKGQDPDQALAGEGDDPGGCGGVEPAAQDQAGNQEAEQRWERIVSQAAEIASKHQGTLPGSIQRLVENIRHPKVPWQDALAEFVSRSFDSRDDLSWKFPHRGYMAQGIILPGLRSQGIGHVLVHVDCSGSTDRFMDDFAAELSGVLDCKPSKVTVIYGDTKVRGEPVEWNPADGPLTMERRGGGGTCHHHLAEFVKAMEDEPVCVVALTDGETSWPEDYGVPTLWVITPDGSKDAPFGQVVEMN